MTQTLLDKGKIEILLLESVHPSAVEAFRRDGYSNIEQHPKSLPETTLAASLRDTDALVDALKSQHLAGAGMDVFPLEPKTSGDEFVSPLHGMDNVVLTPHVGGSTEEAQQNINQPGGLSAINAVFSGEKINIAGQYPQTNAQIGCVVIDVETGERAASLKVKSKLQEVPGTIRTRILY